MFYPANPDALAVGPRGDLAVVRTGSGSDPASANDPALLLVAAMPPVALAPWSTLRLADDPACKEPGWRTTLQAIAPWIRVTTPELRAEDMPMIARVKWSEKRVCLEGFEVKLPDVTRACAGDLELGVDQGRVVARRARHHVRARRDRRRRRVASAARVHDDARPRPEGPVSVTSSRRPSARRSRR